MVHDKDNGPMAPAVTGLHDVLATWQMLKQQDVPPPFAKALLVHQLERLDAAGEPPAVTDALEMDDARARLIEHLISVLAQPEGEVAVLVIGRCVAIVEAAEPGEQLTRH